jgi:hypothetical protein
MATFFEQGLREDIIGDYKKAIDLYIQSIENEELKLDAYLNLIGILIEVSLDFGVSADLIQRRIYSQEELDILCKYLDNLLKKAEIHFNTNEIAFWRYYKENYFKGLCNNQIKEIIKIDDTNLVPYFQLYICDLSSDNDTLHYNQKIEDLTQFLKERLTIKNKYILSLIESAERQKGLEYK